jgi:hypothetical protein
LSKFAYLLHDLLMATKFIEENPYSRISYHVKNGEIKLNHGYITRVPFLNEEIKTKIIPGGKATISQSSSNNNYYVSFSLEAIDEDTAHKLFRDWINLNEPINILKRMIVMKERFNNAQVLYQYSQLFSASGGDLDLIDEVEDLMTRYRSQP